MEISKLGFTAFTEISPIWVVIFNMSAVSSLTTKEVVARHEFEKSKSGSNAFAIAQTAVNCVPPANTTGTFAPIRTPATAGSIGSPTAATTSNGLLFLLGLSPAFFRPSSTISFFISCGFVFMHPLTFPLASYPRPTNTPSAVVVPAGKLSPITI